MSNHKCSTAAPMGLPRNPLSFYFVAGGLGDVCAALVSHPMDVVKVRQQLQGELGASKDGGLGIRNFARTVTTIVRGEGALIGLYRGMSASVARQSSFSTMRHGGYASACTLAVHGSFSAPNWSPNAASRSVPHPASEASVMQRLAAGCACGSVAAFIANPTDVVLVRMQADGHWPLARRRGYYNIFDGARRIVFEEGPRRLWRGSGPTVFRAMLVTATQIPAYFWAKEWLVERVKFGKGPDDPSVHVVSSLFSSGAASIATAPVDVIKTRVMNMQKGGVAMYSGPIDCLLQTLRAEGLKGLFKGLVPTFARLAPHTMVLWVVQEAVLRKLRENWTSDGCAGA